MVGIICLGERRYAQRFSDRWFILSAKYGLIPPDFVIPGSYEVTFKRAATHPVTSEQVRRQMIELGLDQFDLVVVLGGREYRTVVEQAFSGSAVKVLAPFAGLRMGEGMRAVNQAVLSGHAPSSG